MADRALVLEIPPWWLSLFDDAAKQRGYDNTKLAKLLMAPGLTGTVYERALSAARAKVTRFRSGRAEAEKESGPSGTVETIEVFCEHLDLTPWAWFANDATQAEALAFAAKRPDLVLRAARKNDGAAEDEPSRMDHTAAATASPLAPVAPPPVVATARQRKRDIFKKASSRLRPKDRSRSRQGDPLHSAHGEAKPAAGIAGSSDEHPSPRPRRPGGRGA